MTKGIGCVSPATHSSSKVEEGCEASIQTTGIYQKGVRYFTPKSLSSYLLELSHESPCTLLANPTSKPSIYRIHNCINNIIFMLCNLRICRQLPTWITNVCKTDCTCKKETLILQLSSTVDSVQGYTVIPIVSLIQLVLANTAVTVFLSYELTHLPLCVYSANLLTLEVSICKQMSKAKTIKILEKMCRRSCLHLCHFPWKKILQNGS